MGERFWEVLTPGKDARRQHGQNPAARTGNGAIWCKLRPKSILTEAHFGPQGSLAPGLGRGVAPLTNIPPPQYPVANFFPPTEVCPGSNLGSRGNGATWGLGPNWAQALFWVSPFLGEEAERVFPGPGQSFRGLSQVFLGQRQVLLGQHQARLSGGTESHSGARPSPSAGGPSRSGAKSSLP